MRGRRVNMRAIGRAAGFAAVAVAIAAAAVHVRPAVPRLHTAPETSEISGDPLKRELTRCQMLGLNAKDDPACQSAWAENRRRFFTYPPEAR